MATFSYRIENGIAILTYGGDWTFERVADVHRRLAADPAFDPDMPKIIDAGYLMREFDLGEILRVRDLMKELYQDATKIRRVAVVSSDTMIAKITEIYSKLYEVSPSQGAAEYRFFTSMAEAEAWLKKHAI